LRSPIWIEPGGESDAKRLAPPTSRPVSRRALAPSPVSCCISAGTALCGVFAGDWLKVHGAAHRAWWLWAAGTAATAVGLLWNRALPINKNLWTSSYALFSAGVAAQVLAICHWTIDVKRWRGWSRPFAAFGRNPLAAYFLSVGIDAVLARWNVPGSVSLKAWLYRSAFLSWLRPCCGNEAAALGYAVAYVALWGVVVMWMQRRRVFIGI